MSGDLKCSAGFPQGAMVISAVCDCGFSQTYSVTFLQRFNKTKVPLLMLCCSSSVAVGWFAVCDCGNS